MYIETFLHKRCEIDPDEGSKAYSSLAALLVQGVALIFVPFASWLTDKIGIGRVMLIGAGLITLFDWALISSAYYLFKGSVPGVMLVAILLGIIQVTHGFDALNRSSS